MSSAPRTPNFLSFILTGAIVGFAIGGFIAVSGVLEETRTYANGMKPVYSATTSLGYLGLAGALVFGLLGAVVAVLLDRTGKA